MKTDAYAIIGGTLWGNKGAEAMVSTTIARIRDGEKGAAFLLLSYYPQQDRLLARGAGLLVDSATPLHMLLVQTPFALVCWLFRILGVKWPDVFLPGSVKRLRACKMLLDVSGISFHDGRLGVLIYNVFCIWPALLMGVPVVHLSQARGPFRNFLNKALARHCLSVCRHSFARGRITAAHMAGLGLPEGSWSSAADVAFSFRAGDSITNEGEGETQAMLSRLALVRESGRKIVAVSPSSVVLGKTEKVGIDYIGIMARTVVHLHKLGHHVLVLPNATRAGSKGLRNNDIPVIEAIRERLRKEAAVGCDASDWVCWDVNTDAIRRLIESCELLVTSRFHAMVAGLSLGVPVFVVGWSHKYEEVLEMFGCSEDAIDFASLNEGLLPAIDRMLVLCDERRHRISEAKRAVESSSLGQFSMLERFIA